MARVLKKPWHEVWFECVSPHTDAPDSFVVWSALSLVGATLKNNVFFETGTYTVYPNQFIVLVGPPGVGKGTAMQLVEEIIREVQPPVVNTLSDRITAEKIIEQIAQGWNGAFQMQGQQLIVGVRDHTCLLFSTELRVLLGASDWMLEFLEESWSKTNYDYQTKNKGSNSISTMCCSLLAASVPDFLKNTNREVRMVISGGFSSRCLFIYAEQPSKDLPWPEPLKKNLKSKGLYDCLVQDLSSIGQLKGEFKVTATARVMFEDFLKKNRATISQNDTEAMANFRARVKAHVLKLCMILSASSGDGMYITDIHMANAIAYIGSVTKALEKLFRGSGDSMDTSMIERVQSFMDKVTLASRRELMKGLYRHIGSFENLDRCIAILEAIGYMERTAVNNREMFQLCSKNGKAPKAP